MRIHFYLDSKVNKKSERAVYCIVRGIEKGKTYYYRTNRQIIPKHWNPKEERVRKSFIDYSVYNDYLNKIERRIEKVLPDLIDKNPKLSFDAIKKELDAILKNNKKSVLDFFQIFDMYVNEKKNEHSVSTTKKYKALRNHLKEFEIEKNYTITFQNIDFNFEAKFKDYLYIDKNQMTNTASKYVKNLKAVLKWATKNNHNTNLMYQDFTTPTEETDIIYLTEDELMKISKLDLENNKTLDNIRDVFCFCCFTGQRFSDVFAIKWTDVQLNVNLIKKVNLENKIFGFWNLRTKKTKEINRIPINEFAYDILMKHKDMNRPLPVISLQKTNEHLKKLGKIAGIEELVTITKIKANKIIPETNPKYFYMATHTARRTFCTLSLEKGMRPEVVMSITAHKDYKTFKKYIKLTNIVKTNEMNAIWKK